MVTSPEQWNIFISKAIRDKLANANCFDDSFASCAEEYDSLLYDPSNIKDVSLNASWNYADQFFSALEHQDTTMNGISWRTAYDVLLGILDCLEHQKPIQDKRVLSFAWPCG